MTATTKRSDHAGVAVAELRAGPTVRVIAGREMSVKLHDKAFIWSTIFLLAVIVIATALPILLGGRTPNPTVAVVGPGAARVVAGAATLGIQAQRAGPGAPGTPFGLGGVPGANLTVRAASSEATARALVRAGTVDAAVIGDSPARLVVVGKSAVPADLATLLAAASAQEQVTAAADRAGLTAAQVQALIRPTRPQTRLLEPGPTGTIPPQFLVLVFAFLFYMSVLTFGMSIAQSVVEEKQSRVVELLVAAVPVRWLLAGKVLGNTALAVGQIVLLLGVGLVGASVAGQGDLISQVLSASGWFVLFFVLGFVMLACLWAVAGSLASRVEELQSTTVVMQVFVMIPFFAAIFATDPGPVQTFLSYFPLTAPLLMPERVMLGAAAPWEPALAAVIVLAAAVVFVLLGSRLYQGSVLHTSSKLKIGQAWHARG
jgi:ABC-2 type transport system permease protein